MFKSTLAILLEYNSSGTKIRKDWAICVQSLVHFLIQYFRVVAKQNTELWKIFLYVLPFIIKCVCVLFYQVYKAF